MPDTDDEISACQARKRLERRYGVSGPITCLRWVKVADRKLRQKKTYRIDQGCSEEMRDMSRIKEKRL